MNKFFFYSLAYLKLCWVYANKFSPVYCFKLLLLLLILLPSSSLECHCLFILLDSFSSRILYATAFLYILYLSLLSLFCLSLSLSLFFLSIPLFDSLPHFHSQSMLISSLFLWFSPSPYCPPPLSLIFSLSFTSLPFWFSLLYPCYLLKHLV